MLHKFNLIYQNYPKNEWCFSSLGQYCISSIFLLNILPIINIQYDINWKQLLKQLLYVKKLILQRKISGYIFKELWLQKPGKWQASPVCKFWIAEINDLLITIIQGNVERKCGKYLNGCYRSCTKDFYPRQGNSVFKICKKKKIETQVNVMGGNCLNVFCLQIVSFKLLISRRLRIVNYLFEVNFQRVLSELHLNSRICGKITGNGE